MIMVSEVYVHSEIMYMYVVVKLLVMLNTT